MILGIGTDIVDVARFNRWKEFPENRLQKVFSQKELFDCKLSPEKLAVRFAAKEAFYKALSNSLITFGFTRVTFSFMFACRNISVEYTTWNVPILHINWKEFEDKIGKKLSKIKTHLSLSHERETAIAFVVLEKE